MDDPIAWVELTDRSLGGGAKVSWLSNGEDHMIVVHDQDAEIVCLLSEGNWRDARETFFHPFACKHTPDIYKGKHEGEVVPVTPTQLREAGAI